MDLKQRSLNYLTLWLYIYIYIYIIYIYYIYNIYIISAGNFRYRDKQPEVCSWTGTFEDLVQVEKVDPELILTKSIFFSCGSINSVESSVEYQLRAWLVKAINCVVLLCYLCELQFPHL